MAARLVRLRRKEGSNDFGNDGEGRETAAENCSCVHGGLDGAKERGGRAPMDVKVPVLDRDMFNTAQKYAYPFYTATSWQTSCVSLIFSTF